MHRSQNATCHRWKLGAVSKYWAWYVRKGAADCPSSPLALPVVRVLTVYFEGIFPIVHMRGQVVRSWSPEITRVAFKLAVGSKDCAATHSIWHRLVPDSHDTVG